MAGATAPELVAAVSNAGGLGSLGGSFLPPDALREAIRQARALTDRPFAVNLFAWKETPETPHRVIDAMSSALRPYLAELGLGDPETPSPPPMTRMLERQLVVIAEERVPVFSFTFGIPPLDLVREAGAVVAGTATTVEEAVALEQAGVDLVVVQGSEAGGHRGTFARPHHRALVGLVALVPQVVDRIRVPVLAAGGIMDGRGIAAAIALGAEGVQLGTAFLACDESAASEPHKRALCESSDDATVVTAVYSGRHARAIETPLIDQLERAGLEIPPFPLQAMLTRNLHEAAAEHERADLMFLLSGQGAPLSRRTSAARLVEMLAGETEDVLRGLPSA